MSNSSYTNEQRLIEDIKEWTGSAFIGDDCAVIDGKQLITADSLVEGTHFILESNELRDLGWKAVAVNLSDIAAMAGRPKHLMISLTIPNYIHTKQLKEIYAGMIDCARAYKTSIAGGDLTKGPVLVFAITAIGDTNEYGVLKRSGAKSGDVVVVTGDFGASRAGLWLSQNPAFPDLQELKKRFRHCIESHLRPKPCFDEAWKLVKKISKRGALMDASDGLSDALVQIARASDVGMNIDLLRVPIHYQTREVSKIASANADEWALYGGEDYQLVGTLAKDVFDSWKEDNPFKQIGLVTQSGKVEFMIGDKHGPELNLSHCFQQIDN